jgi:murein L,D-transpeptidase YafK
LHENNAHRYRILIDKQARALTLLCGGELQLAYPIDLGRAVAPDKRVEGDEATPLGEFYVCAKNPRSKFFRSLCISYPNAEHAERGLRDALISADEHAQILQALRAGNIPLQHTRLGGEIYIHGRVAGEASTGTRGCIALQNDAMLALYERVPLGTPITIL